MTDDATICALSTAPGHGAIAIVRLSGEQSISLADSVFRSPRNGKQLTHQKPNTIHFGSIEDQGQVIDEVLVSIFKAPYSYTGENMVEISCHGSVYIQQQILKTLTKAGARMAEPGEFTMRAFLNGKMDLSQAEAVADLIASESKAAHRMAMDQMRGGFSKEIHKLREKLLNFSSLIELELDFSEEDVEFANRSELTKLIGHIQQLLKYLMESFDYGNVIKNGVPVAIVGRPNVGKSTLLNTLLNEDRALVSEIAGTTRDAIEDEIHIEGIRFRFIDTAGIRETSDRVESMGIERTFAKISKARIILLLTDPNQTAGEIERQIEEINPLNHQKLLVLINKIDQFGEEALQQKFKGWEEEHPYPILFISAKKRIHTDRLTQALIQSVNLSPQSDVIVSNARHYAALSNASEAAVRVIEGITGDVTSDLVAQDIRAILYYLGEITGEITTDEILGNIFSKFCIGK